jgi:hypothetical protein
MLGSGVARDLGWTGAHPLAPPGEVGCWRIGPLSVFVLRERRQIRIGARYDADRHAAAVETSGRGTLADLDRSGFSVRVPVADPVEDLYLAPRTADRWLLARVESRLLVPAGGRVDVFVAAPIWIDVSIGKRTLAEVPGFRPADAWWGPDTTRGELAYASRTKARLDAADMPRSPVRSITPVRIANPDDAPRDVERIALPLPEMSLFESEDGRLWTEALAMALDPPGATPRIEPGPPREAGAGKLVARPRRGRDDGGLTRAMGALVGLGGSGTWRD